MDNKVGRFQVVEDQDAAVEVDLPCIVVGAIVDQDGD